MRKMVLDGVQLVKEKTHPLVVQEYLMAYMLPAERERFKKKAGAAAGG
jgi:flagellar motor component MotA